MPHSSPPPAEGSRDPLRRSASISSPKNFGRPPGKTQKKLAVEPLTQEIGRQLYAAVSSIAANISEGYSRSSDRDRARISEYALGPVRESMSWYHAAEPVPGEALTAARLEPLEEMRRMRRMLLAIIPRERGRVMKKYGGQTPA